jgi:hypothetical protein
MCIGFLNEPYCKILDFNSRSEDIIKRTNQVREWQLQEYAAQYNQLLALELNISSGLVQKCEASNQMLNVHWSSEADCNLIVSESKHYTAA